MTITPITEESFADLKRVAEELTDSEVIVLNDVSLTDEQVKILPDELMVNFAYNQDHTILVMVISKNQEIAERVLERIIKDMGGSNIQRNPIN